MKKLVLLLTAIILIFSVSPVFANSVTEEKLPITEDLTDPKELLDELRLKINNLENLTNQNALLDGVNIESLVNQNEILDELHKKVVKSGLVSLNEDGLIEIHASAEDLAVDKDLFDNYLFKMERSNYLVIVGGYNFDTDFNLVSLSNDEAIKDIQLKNQKKIQTNSLYSLKGNSSNFSTLNSLPVLNAIGIATKNKQEVQDYYVASLYIEGSGTAAVYKTTAFWVASVTNGGVWDYKSLAGYSPNTKQWNAYTRYSYTTGVTRTSEWFGNYNYGYTGRFLFSLSVLYAGGNFAGVLWGGHLDTALDQAAIKMGYDESI
ncbi:hypothetical protein BK120_22940 [Paenibacillus sp. FSL A5-0031]|uniref:polymorphic toxin type 44 domain-containing protein n=1 Tax=Paenibacillus sp. FSL A5-0031 TaxID=1920420 RepID=UPI00096E8321|nr:polymorphic toxin type 44 domain-containing protein [Paenibacillus sp. FSL A5-0031]OME78598.1 hypothetical protein BK120_22940 [Paenibacillus sp. FSL A5-0031]